MNKLLIASIVLLVLIILAGCTKHITDNRETPTPSPTVNEVDDTEQTAEEKTSTGYEQITPQEAKKLMDSGDADVILDVRTEDEFETGHIQGAILIPDYQIEDTAESILPDKNAMILVYCRSGRRSKLASEALAKLGYTNVKEFGGIIDWPYETSVSQTCGGA